MLFQFFANFSQLTDWYFSQISISVSQSIDWNWLLSISQLFNWMNWLTTLVVNNCTINFRSSVAFNFTFPPSCHWHNRSPRPDRRYSYSHSYSYCYSYCYCYSTSISSIASFAPSSWAQAKNVKQSVLLTLCLTFLACAPGKHDIFK